MRTEEERVKSRLYYRENIERIRARARAYRARKLAEDPAGLRAKERERSRRWAERHPERWEAINKASQQRRQRDYQALKNAERKRLKADLIEKRGGACQDCGIRGPAEIYHFDHRDPNEKVSELSRLIKSSSMDRIMAEIAKCDLVCANCHAIRTASDRRIHRKSAQAMRKAHRRRRVVRSSKPKIFNQGRLLLEFGTPLHR